MACRIEMIKGAEHRTVTVAGRLEQVHVPDLIRACAKDAGPVLLDLTDLLAADAVAIDALRRLRSDGVELIRLPLYLEFTLDDR